jgi:hypothetical protein
MYSCVFNTKTLVKDEVLHEQQIFVLHKQLSFQDPGVKPENVWGNFEKRKEKSGKYGKKRKKEM